jgi:hypothetical protein
MEDLLIHLKKVICFSEIKLEVDCYGFASIYHVITSITLVENSTTWMLHNNGLC